MSPRKKQLQPDITGIAGDVHATQSGTDARKRGWYWHWNATVTQFAPLIGLKGVGLLNSYTVWTDRREESPTRGYAFPSQQSEADFYGEDRAELITINKILVELDLIEIRKEMVVRPDDQGRRWKVPHNFYRVKDRDDGYTLDGDAVMRVVRLADRDKAVYRYLRHIFSEKFRPIDAHNVWTTILAEVRQDPTWQKLAARTAADERRASERTKLGHASRKDKTGVRTHARPDSDSNTVATVTVESVPQTSVADSNKGSPSDVAPTNEGSNPVSPTVVAPVNTGGPTFVAETNTTYYQDKTTTTTRDGDAPSAYGENVFDPSSAPGDLPNRERTLRRFSEANGREPTAAERKILSDLAERFDLAARECGHPDLASGWAWVAAAIYEAVDSGSAYVAPKRVREILLRWEREGVPGAQPAPAPDRSVRPANARRRTPSPQQPEPFAPKETVRQPDRPAADPESATDGSFAPPVIPVGAGLNSLQLWPLVLAHLQQDGLPASELELWLRPAVVLAVEPGERHDTIVLGAPNRSAAVRIEQRFGHRIEQVLVALLGRPVAVSVMLLSAWLDDRSAAAG